MSLRIAPLSTEQVRARVFRVWLCAPSSTRCKIHRILDAQQKVIPSEISPLIRVVICGSDIYSRRCSSGKTLSAQWDELQKWNMLEWKVEIIKRLAGLNLNLKERPKSSMSYPVITE